MRLRTLLRAVAAAWLLAAPNQAYAQQRCVPTGTREINVIAGIAYLSVARLACPDNLRVRADSATLYQETRTYHFFGHVVFDNPEIHLESQNAEFYDDQGLIMAHGSVVMRRKTDGTTITGAEELVLYRAGSLGRTEDALTVSGGRPRALIPPRQAEGAPRDTAAAPYDITADRIEVTGESRLQATGRVEILRGDLDARGDQVLYLSDSGQLRLTGSASLDVETYVLTGGVILVTMADDEIQDVIARQDAQLTGDFTLEGGVIQIQMAEGALDRVTAGPDDQPGAARPPGPDSAAAAPRRATAVAEDYTITGDRVIIEVAGDRLQTLDARGAARVVSTVADSINAADTPDIARSDWIEGDTILALFTEVASPDSAAAPVADSAAAKPQLETLVARVNARALVRMPAADTTNADNPACDIPGRFAVHYVIGDSITLRMGDGTVQEMEVIGEVQGHHWEPPACAAAPADTTLPASPTTGAQPQFTPGGAPPPLPPAAPGDPRPGVRPRPRGRGTRRRR